MKHSDFVGGKAGSALNHPPGFQAAFAGALFVLISGAALAGDDGMHAIELNAAVDHARVGIDDDISVCASLKNVQGSGYVTVYGRLGWGEWWGLRLEVLRGGTQRVLSQEMDHLRAIPSTFEEPEYFVPLRPGHSLGFCRVDKGRDLFQEPGDYELQVSYLSPAPRKYSNAPGLLSMEDGRLHSRRVRIEVLP
ncbi:hypothetical protein ACYX7E_14675 [Luteimonas sp. RIT-PG2_3]